MAELGGGSGQDVVEYVQRIGAAAASVDDNDLVVFYQGAVAGIADPVVRRAVEAMLVQFGRGVAARLAPASARQVVVLVHGIRTQAVWQEPLAALLTTLPNVTAKPVRYGRFDIIKFLIPSPFRTDPIRHLERQLRIIIAEHPGAKLSVIAHSYGTYAISRVLWENSDLRLHRLILCGSIVPPRFAWDRVSNQVSKRPILNECGTHDVWPVFANISTWGFGPSGTFGFQNVAPHNRFYALSHSDFLKREFYETAWIPLFADPDREPGFDDGPPPASPAAFPLISMLPIQWIVLVGIIGYALWLLWRTCTAS